MYIHMMESPLDMSNASDACIGLCVGDFDTLA